MRSESKQKILEKVGVRQLQEVTRLYPAGARLYRQGQIPTGVFYIQEGVIQLLSADREPQPAMTGDLLGLSELFAGMKYESSAVCGSLARVTYVEKDDFILRLKAVEAPGLSPGMLLSCFGYRPSSSLTLEINSSLEYGFSK